jgi:DNA-binding SARP family transcriptional activator
VAALTSVVGMQRVSPADPSRALDRRRPVRLKLLGGFELNSRGTALRVVASAQRLLAFVALQEHAVPRVHVAGVLWPDVSEERASKSLRNALWRLGLPGCQLVDGSGRYLRLASQVSVDVLELRGLARDGMHAADGFLGGMLDLSLFAGELLPGWYDEWVQVERERCNQMVMLLLERRCQALTRTERWAEAVMAGFAAVSRDPLRESAQRALIGAYLGQGNLVAASRQYRGYCTLLERS